MGSTSTQCSRESSKTCLQLDVEDSFHDGVVVGLFVFFYVSYWKVVAVVLYTVVVAQMIER